MSTIQNTSSDTPTQNSPLETKQFSTKTDSPDMTTPKTSIGSSPKDIQLMPPPLSLDKARTSVGDGNSITVDKLKRGSSGMLLKDGLNSPRVESSPKRLQQVHFIRSVATNLSENNFLSEFLHCQDGKVPIHRVFYALCPLLLKKSLLNYSVLIVTMFRHFIYRDEISPKIQIIEAVTLYELGVLLEIPQLCMRILKIISKPGLLTIENFDDGFKTAFESDHNDGSMDPLIYMFQNYYIDNKNEIFNIESSRKKTLSMIKSKMPVSLKGDDDWTKCLSLLKESLWKSKDYKDMNLLCSDDHVIECHKAVIGMSPLFARFNTDLDPGHCPVEFKWKPLSIFIDILYRGRSSMDVQLDVLFDLYHIFKQSEFDDLARQVIVVLKSVLDESNCMSIFEFYVAAHLDDSSLLSMLQNAMKTKSPFDLCSIYITSREKNPEFLKSSQNWILSAMTKESSSAWLSALDDHQIDDPLIWEKLESTMNSDTFHIWNIFQTKLTKTSDIMESQAVKITDLQAEVMSLKQNDQILAERLQKIEAILLKK